MQVSISNSTRSMGSSKRRRRSQFGNFFSFHHYDHQFERKEEVAKKFNAL